MSPNEWQSACALTLVKVRKDPLITQALPPYATSFKKFYNELLTDKFYFQTKIEWQSNIGIDTCEIAKRQINVKVAATSD